MTSSPLLFLLLLVASSTAFSPSSTFTTPLELSCPHSTNTAAARVVPRSSTPVFLLQPLAVSKKPDALEISTSLDDDDELCIVAPEEELSDTQILLQKIKDAGTAGVISYALWELAFWALSVPVCVFGYYEVTGHFPDLNNKEDMAKLGGEAFAFVNFARFAVPLRIGLALGTTPWIQENVVDRFFKKEEEVVCLPSEEEEEDGGGVSGESGGGGD